MTTSSALLGSSFENAVTADSIAAASKANLRGPYHHGDITAFVFRGRKSNGQPAQLHVLEDRGLAGSDSGSTEVDMNQLSPEEMAAAAQDWFRVQVGRGKFSLSQTVAVVFDSARTGSPELNSPENSQKFLKLLEAQSRHGWVERASCLWKQLITAPA